MANQPRIKSLAIRRFRGIEILDWRPSAGINVLLGGGDSGKSTVLHAIALLFSPTNAVQVFETDYFNRSTDDGFSIEAVVDIPPEVGIADFSSLWPWEWDGSAAVLPDPEVEKEPNHPVFRFRVRGTEDLELVWELVQPNAEIAAFSTGLRRRIGVLRLANDDRNDRDLRLVTGSALDRLLSKGNLKSRLNKQVAETDLSAALLKEETKVLEDLGSMFEKAGLPHDLELGLTSSQGLSIGALIGLLADRAGVKLPLASWGAGTRRMSALEVAGVTEASSRLTVIDEIERGLEPYRLRQLLAKLVKDDGQCFVTTHSPVAIKAATKAALWFIDAKGAIGALPAIAIAQQQARDPETFLAKLPVIAEGVTEVGFLRFLLRNAFVAAPEDHGIRLCDGGGNESMLGLLVALRDAGLMLGAFCDNEGKSTGRWKSVSKALGPRCFQWHNGCLEANVIAHVDDATLFSLARDSEGASGERLRTLADRLGLQAKDEASILAACGPPEECFAKLRSLIVAAATGSKEGAPDVDTAKDWAKHSRRWFKSEEGGYELGLKMVELSVWPKLEPELLPFVNALRAALGQPALAPGQLKL
ncbi:MULTISPECIES: ATP-dependent nuclease [unclassified Bradyrhizobium]|uniref:ATP-dependent nuclease n=1 Tax=unclassified Bradyrhizobium TaxID=2631580 RepID=UPI0028E7CABD|nr:MULTISPECIES: AAA family ATPase [unclassified Bradyrhizobium]